MRKTNHDEFSSLSGSVLVSVSEFSVHVSVLEEHSDALCSVTGRASADGAHHEVFVVLCTEHRNTLIDRVCGGVGDHLVVHQEGDAARLGRGHNESEESEEGNQGSGIIGTSTE